MREKYFFKFFLGSLIKKGNIGKAFFFLRFLIKNFKIYNLHPFFFFEYISSLVKPVMILKDYYAGRTKYRIPYFIFSLTGYRIGHRWLIENAGLRKEKLFKFRLFQEMVDTLSIKFITRSNKKKQLYYKNIIKNRPYLKHVKYKNF